LAAVQHNFSELSSAFTLRTVWGDGVATGEEGE